MVFVMVKTIVWTMALQTTSLLGSNLAYYLVEAMDLYLVNYLDQIWLMQKDTTLELWTVDVIEAPTVDH